MIKHLAVFFSAAAALKYFFDLSFFQVIVVCLLIGIYNMVYTLMTQGLEIHFD